MAEMRTLLRRAMRGGLLFAWLVSAALLVVMLLTKDYWLAVAVACVAIVGTIVQLRKRSPDDLSVSWDAALSISRPRPPRFEQIDREHPLLALIVTGEQRGVYVNVVPAVRIADWAYQSGPTAWGPTPFESVGLVDDVVANGEWMHDLRFLPQGELADEIWRRNFDSLRRGRHFRGLPATRAI
jgi:hypothetical protein